jgi:hypothetical protein
MESVRVIDLLAKYKSTGKDVEILNEFEKWLDRNGEKVNPVNYELNMKAGDVVQFRNGYGVLMSTEILGFSEGAKAYLLWDCYWADVDLINREAKLIE